ncbi:MAG: long-chain fatty acid--CoA ligase [Deltaproteobacteria bacterium]|nr:long-chain fatty acid--CoA ligase [Deltaproteobacteria bacterium]
MKQSDGATFMKNPMTYADKPWLKSYKLGPYKLEESLAPYPKVPVFKALDDAAEKYPGQTALLFLGRTIKFRDLKIQADRLAAALGKIGVKKGDKVCLFLPNCMEFVISDWAVLKAGAAVVPTSVLRTDEGLMHEVKSSGSKVIICQEEYLERILRVKERGDIDRVIVTSKQGFDVGDVSVTLPEGVHEFRKLLASHDPAPPQVDIDPTEDLCELAFTGGATGIPKGVMITHYNRYCCLQQGLPWIMKPLLKGIAGKSSVLLPIPLFHSYGHYVEQAAAYLGMRIILMPDPRDTEMLVQYIREYRPLFIPAVPTQLMRLAQAKVGKMNVILMSGSAPLPREVAEAVKNEIGTPVSEGYGLTETSPLTHFNLSGFSKITGFMPKDKGGLGIPAPDTECKLVNPETREEVPFGEPGEIVVRGPQIMKGYWPNPGSGLTEDGWLHTGDIAVMDEEGYFHLSDRTKDMVNISGMKVYTTTVDEVLYKHPAVHMAAAFGVPDPHTPGSERVMAVIQLKEGYKGKVPEEEIREFCRNHLAPYAIPKFIEFREEMPLTVTEKLFKKALRDEALKKRGENKPG